ncbi:GDSL esterase/lipase LTL1-like protein [Tanacetum coccineum]
MATSKSLAIFWFLLFALFSEAALKANARAFFVFGDSLVDNGNNNYLTTTARADNVPYGIDYPTKRPTGREAIGSEANNPKNFRPKPHILKLLVGANFLLLEFGILTIP